MARFTTSKRVHNVRNGWHLFRNRRTLWQMIREVFSGTYRMSFITTLVIIGSICYIISPIDLIPDWIPVLGWIDDAFVFYLMLRVLVRETQRYNRQKAMRRKPA